MMRLGAKAVRGTVCFMTILLGGQTFSAGVAHALCVGDCNNDGEVTVDELVTMVNIALGTIHVSTCQAGDANHDAEITVDEIIAGVNNALMGCTTGTPAPTVTPTPTSGTGGALGTRHFVINSARSPFTVVLSPGFSLPLGRFTGQSHGQTEPGFMDLRAGAPASGFATIDVLSSSEYFYASAMPTAPLVLCIKPIVPAMSAGIVQCNGGLDFSIALQYDHHLGQVGVNGYTAKQCLTSCLPGTGGGCGSIEGRSQICAAGLIGELCRSNADCNSTAVAQDGTCGLGRLCSAGKIGDPCAADSDCTMGTVSGLCSVQPRCSDGKSGTCRADADCDTDTSAEDGICGSPGAHPGVCNSPLTVSQLGGDSGPGAVTIAPVPQFGLNGLNVQITTEGALPCGDEGGGLNTPFPLTTGSVRATVINFGNADRTCTDGTQCMVDADCGDLDPPTCGTDLVYNTSGENFSCSDWQNPTGPGCFVLTTPLLDGNPMGGDLVTAFKFCGH